MMTKPFDEASPIPVAVKRRIQDLADGLLHSDLETDLERARWLANWLDTKYSVGGVRFGFDSILGLIPGIGDTVATLIGLYPIYVAQRHGLGKTVQARMVLNLVMDWAVGLIPGIGDAADVFYRGNVRNVRLLEKAASGRGQESPR
ncbi:MAG: DUF4112 domain-containing protein [Bacillota bacterium]